MSEKKRAEHIGTIHWDRILDTDHFKSFFFWNNKERRLERCTVSGSSPNYEVSLDVVEDNFPVYFGKGDEGWLDLI